MGDHRSASHDQTTIRVVLDAAALDDLERIVDCLAHHDRSVPNRSRAMRWALAELAARLELGMQARHAGGAAPVVSAPGPLVPPPD